MIDLEELERLAKAATPGPWFCKSVPGLGGGRHNKPHIFADGVCLPVASLSVIKGEEDASYIVAACNAVPSLIARVRDLEQQRDKFAAYMETMCRYCDRDGHCPIFNYCPAPNFLKSCGDMKKADWIQAAEEAGE